MITMQSLMSRISNDVSQFVSLSEVNGVLKVFDDTNAKSYWFQFHENEVFAIVPYDLIVNVSADGGLIIPKKYIVHMQGSSFEKCDYVVHFLNKQEEHRLYK